MLFMARDLVIMNDRVVTVVENTGVAEQSLRAKS